MSTTSTTTTLTPQEIVERTLAAGRHLLGCVVIVSETSEAVLRWANSTMTTNGSTLSSRVTVAALVDLPGGPAAGTVSLGEVVTDPARLVDLVAAAERSAREAGPAKDAAPLPEPSAEDPGWGEPGARTSIAVYADLAEGLAEVLAGPARQFGFADHSLTTSWLGTSTGVRRRWVQPTGSVELNAKSADSSAWVGAATRDYTDVDVRALAAEAERRLAWSSRKVSLEPGRYETLMPPSAVSDMLVYLGWSMEGRAAQEGHSAFTGRAAVGERLTDLPLTLYSDPAEPGLEYEPVVIAGGGPAVFDNGAPTRRVEWIREGEVHELQYTRAEAAEFGTAFTPAGDNMILTGGSSASIEELVANTRRGLLLTCLWYIREVDPATLLLTGLTRDGVYLVEDGEVTAEVDHNFRFNYSPLDMLRRATEVGATAPALPREWKDYFTRCRFPGMRVPDFRMSSVSLGR
ncbi:metallopeptidase TldD-related protein [Pseudonocardia sp. WMMC193]|uniref:metallopeptidase TldD-related protein n=1 Tax=Pseudonocardia sp. WMMC193 TaxID=2911965 RepID=UPI001F26F7CB|nr:metallopeptidase TldD-related protein [Pseudonocardia sp. WMMC193]MCF7551997.1 metallopeptidase TldD-related protein [Pseudonocardia sp. WMMC193]